MFVKHCLNCRRDYDSDCQSPYCPHRALPAFVVTERITIEPNSCARCMNWAWGPEHRAKDPQGWANLADGKLVHHPDCPEANPGHGRR